MASAGSQRSEHSQHSRHADNGAAYRHGWREPAPPRTPHRFPAVPPSVAGGPRPASHGQSPVSHPRATAQQLSSAARILVPVLVFIVRQHARLCARHEVRDGARRREAEKSPPSQSSSARRAAGVSPPLSHARPASATAQRRAAGTRAAVAGRLSTTPAAPAAAAPAFPTAATLAGHAGSDMLQLVARCLAPGPRADPIAPRPCDLPAERGPAACESMHAPLPPAPLPPGFVQTFEMFFRRRTVRSRNRAP